MRAEQWLMLGVVGAGLYAVYRMTHASSASNPQSSNTGPSVTPQIPKTPLPDIPVVSHVPGPAALPGGVKGVLSQGALALANSRAYRGRIETIDASGNPTPAPFSPNATTDQIAAVFAGLGFDNAQAFATPTAARNGGFPDWSLANPGTGTRWFYGRWTLPTKSVPAPPGVSLAWQDVGGVRPDAFAGVNAFPVASSYPFASYPFLTRS